MSTEQRYAEILGANVIEIPTHPKQEIPSWVNPVSSMGYIMARLAVVQQLIAALRRLLPDTSMDYVTPIWVHPIDEAVATPEFRPVLWSSCSQPLVDSIPDVRILTHHIQRAPQFQAEIAAVYSELWRSVLQLNSEAFTHRDIVADCVKTVMSIRMGRTQVRPVRLSSSRWVFDCHSPDLECQLTEFLLFAVIGMSREINKVMRDKLRSAEPGDVAHVSYEVPQLEFQLSQHMLSIVSTTHLVVVVVPEDVPAPLYVYAPSTPDGTLHFFSVDGNSIDYDK